MTTFARIAGNNNRLGVKAEPPQLPSYTFTLGFDYSKPTSFGETMLWKL